MRIFFTKTTNAWLWAAVCLLLPCCLNRTAVFMQPTRVVTAQEVVALFPSSVIAVTQLARKARESAQSGIRAILHVPDEQRNFNNTLGTLDTLGAQLGSAASVLSLLTMVSPDEALREAAQAESITLQNFSSEHIAHNKELYKSINYYAQHKAPQEQLSDAQRYFIAQALKGYKHTGIQLPDEQQEKIKKIKRELSELELAFDKNIASDNKTIRVSLKELDGVPQKLIASLEKTHDNNYKIGVDYPTYTAVMDNCKVEKTRKALWEAFNTRGYPSNKQVLDRIQQLRLELARLIGFKDYAHFDIDDEMAQTPEKVEAFLDELVTRCEKKVAQEIAHLKVRLPKHITMVHNQFQPWDRAFIENVYKKQYLALNETKIANYFPLEHTLAKLFEIYEQFFGVTFKKEPVTGLWHKDVELLKVYKNQEFIGTVLLDLFPRDCKYSHACQVGIVPAVRQAGVLYPSVIVVIANFPKPTSTCPTLLRRSDVVTFFHEFGHALHGLLGITELASFSGTHVKTDFVEMPSQMLEQWMWDPAILKMVSKHYKTGKPLSDELIEALQKVKNFNEGDHIQGQLFYSFFSLELFKENSPDCDILWEKLHKKLRPHIAFYPESKGYAAFGHLMGYGAKYYAYLWSKVYALDLFATIQKAGLLNGAMGEYYSKTVLAPGGSQEPLVLLQNFLGRAPNSEAFFKDLGV